MTLTVRLDTEHQAMLDELVTHYSEQGRDLGLWADRSSTIRLLIRDAHGTICSYCDSGEGHPEGMLV